jgi:Uma2 family endonuclease
MRFDHCTNEIRVMGAPATVPRRKLSVTDYHRMGEAGILHEDDRVELIQGELIEVAPIGSRHASMVSQLTYVLTQAAGTTAFLWAQNPIALPPDSEPQPDIALLKPRTDYYAGSLPGPEDVLLVIEVADTTLAYDRDVKLPLYAQHGIPEVWLFDVQAGSFSIYRDPSPQGYQRVLSPGKSEAVSLAMLPDFTIDLATIWG